MERPQDRDDHERRGLAAPDLRAEALGQHAVVPLERGRRQERLARRHDAVAARAGHSDDEIRIHGIPGNKVIRGGRDSRIVQGAA